MSRRRSEGALGWCQFGFSVFCVGSGVALCFTGFPFVGGPLITAGTCLHIKVEINPR
ncbi:hypothetical protein AB0N37_25475 [Streptomyces griseoincarnatus]